MLINAPLLIYDLINSTFLRISYAENSTALMTAIIPMIVGAMIGILINYFADVLPPSHRLTQPLCPNCSQPYSIRDYVIFHKCSNCGQKRSIRSVIILILSIISCIFLNFFPFANLSFWATLPLLVFLGVILVIDIEHHLVLFETSLVGLVLCLIYGIIIGGFSRTLLGGLGGLLIMFVFYLLGIAFSKIVSKLRGQEIKEVAFGFGDVWAGTFLGLLAGWPGIAGASIIAIFSFAAFSVILLIGLIVSKRYRAFASAQPFVPFLIFGTILIFYL